jgi:hypothetical protein
MKKTYITWEMDYTPRNIFEDDKKLIRLCEDYIHWREELRIKGKTDHTKTATPSNLIAIIRYDNDPIPLTMDEFLQLQEFCAPYETGFPDSQFSDFKLAYIQNNSQGFYTADGEEIHPMEGGIE